MAYQTTKKSNEPTKLDEQSGFATIVQLVLDYLTDPRLMILIATNINVRHLWLYAIGFLQFPSY